MSVRLAPEIEDGYRAVTHPLAVAFVTNRHALQERGRPAVLRFHGVL
jgi:hypothetical protein